MYNALTPLFDHVTNADLFSDFKSEQFGLGSDGPGTIEPVPFPGVTIVRDRFHVPHVTATTHAGGVWAAGWIAAEDRGLLLQEARDNSYVAAIDVPGLTAIGLIENLQNFQPSAQTKQVVDRQTQVLQKAGPEGRDVLSRHRRVHHRNQRVPEDPQPDDPAVDARRHLRAQRAQGPVLRRGRRPRGPELRVPGRARAPARDQQGLQRLQRPAPEPQRRQPDDRRRHVQLRPHAEQARRPGQRRARSGQLPRHAGGVVGQGGQVRAPRASSPRLQRADGGGQVLHHRAPAAGRRPAGGLLLSRPDLRDRHARSRPGLARGDLGAVPRLHADRARAGLRHDADLGLRGRRGRVRRDAVRPQQDEVPVQRQVPVDAELRRRHARRQDRRLQDHSPRTGRGVRPRAPSAGGDLEQALELRQGRAGPAVQPPPLRRPGPQPPVVLQGCRAHAADVQLVLHRRQARGRDHHRPPPAPAQGHRPEPADDRHRQVRVARLCA